MEPELTQEADRHYSQVHTLSNAGQCQALMVQAMSNIA
jgi:hypothetical protein